MDRLVLIVYKFSGPAITIRVSSGTTFDEFKALLLSKGVSQQTVSSNMLFVVPNFSECALSNNDDWENMMIMLESSGSTVATVHPVNFVDSGCLTQIITTGSNEASGSNRDIGPSNIQVESNRNEVEESIGPQIDLPHVEKKDLLTAPWAHYIEGVDQIFKGGVVEVRTKLAKFCIEKGYKFEFVRNTKKQVMAKCAKREQYGCDWYFNATIVKHTSWLKLRVYHAEHTCPIEVRNHERLSAAMMAWLIIDKLRDNPDLIAPDVVSLFKESYGLNVGYKQAWRAIEKARDYIYGKHVDSYNELKWQILNLKEVNPQSFIIFEDGMVTNPESGETKNRFIRTFISFEASIQGFEHCRPMLCIDATFLSGRYQGVLMAATGKDGNNGLFPVAFAIVSAENKENWKWFLENLVSLIPPSRNVIYVSDRNVGLVSLFQNEFAHLTHFYCLHHLKGNLRDRFKSFDAGYKEAAANALSECARAPTPFIFEQKLNDLKNYGVGIVNHFLQGIPVEKWAFAFAPCQRFGEMTSNASESYNNWIKGARQLPITQCVDLIRSQTMEWFQQRRTKAANRSTMFCETYQSMWDSSLYESRGWMIRRCSDYVFEVGCHPSVTVNIEERTCDCYAWQFSGFPCKHGVAALHASKFAIEDYVDSYYFNDTYRKCYAGIIYPVATIRKYTHSTDLGEMVYPPNTGRQPGRPPKKRIPSRGEQFPKRSYRCGRCGGIGHGSLKCKHPLCG